ncbi:hypothetical protein JOB18_027940, partial [Solea senegalensis]
LCCPPQQLLSRTLESWIPPPSPCALRLCAGPGLSDPFRRRSRIRLLHKHRHSPRRRDLCARLAGPEDKASERGTCSESLPVRAFPNEMMALERNVGQEQKQQQPFRSCVLQRLHVKRISEANSLMVNYSAPEQRGTQRTDPSRADQRKGFRPDCSDIQAVDTPQWHMCRDLMMTSSARAKHCGLIIPDIMYCNRRGQDSDVGRWCERGGKRWRGKTKGAELSPGGVNQRRRAAENHRACGVNTPSFIARHYPLPALDMLRHTCLDAER